MEKKIKHSLIATLTAILLLLSLSFGMIAEPTKANAGGPAGSVGSLSEVITADGFVEYDIPVGYYIMGHDLGTTYFSVKGLTDDTFAVVYGYCVNGSKYSTADKFNFRQAVDGKETTAIRDEAMLSIQGGSVIKIKVFRGSVEVDFEYANAYEPRKPAITEDALNIKLYTDTIIYDHDLLVKGKAFPGLTVELFVDGKSMGTAVTNIVGDYVFKCELPDEGDMKTYNVRVDYPRDRSIFAEANVTYSATAPEVTRFDMDYFSGVNDSVSHYDLLNNASNQFLIASKGGTYKFHVGFNDNKLIKGVVVADSFCPRNSVKAVYDEKEGCYVSEGVFYEDRPEAVPEKPVVKYILGTEDDYFASLVCKNTVEDYKIQSPELSDVLFGVKSDVFGGETIYSFDISDNNYDIIKQMLGNEKADMLKNMKLRINEKKDNMQLAIDGKDLVIEILNVLENGDISDYLSSGNDIFNFVFDASESTKDEAVFKLKIGSAAADVLKIAFKATGHNAEATVMGAVSDLTDIFSNPEKNGIDGIWDALTTMFEYMPVDPFIVAEGKAEYAFISGVLDITTNFFDNGFDLVEKILSGQDISNISATDLLGIRMNDKFMKFFSKQNVHCTFDPSGYVYGFTEDDRIEYATVTAWCIPYDSADGNFWDTPDESKAEIWNASEYSQSNPLQTNVDGYYYWDVPQGWWQVRVEKDGYETACSEWMIVPPERTNVNIQLRSVVSPECVSVTETENGIKATFSDYIDVSSVGIDNFTLLLNGKELVINDIRPVDSSYSEACGVEGAKEFEIVFDKNESGIVEVTITGCTGYNGKTMIDFSGEVNCTENTTQEDDIQPVHKMSIIERILEFFSRIITKIKSLLGIKVR